MKIKYNVTITPLFAETHLVPSESPAKSDFYLEKTQEFEQIETTLHSEKVSDVYASVLKQTKTREGYKLTVNTTNIVGSNIKDENGTVYYYVITGEGIKDSDVRYLNAFKYKGNYYTNSPILNLEVREGVYLNTELVLDLLIQKEGEIKHVFGSEIILYVSLKDTDTEWYFKPLEELVFTPRRLNSNTILFPSFKTELGSCIEGDIREVTKVEYLQSNLNMLQPKNKILWCKHPYCSFTNTVFLPTTPLNSIQARLRYTAYISSHTFRFETDTIYFKLTPFMLEQGTQEDHDFCVDKVYDLSALKKITNHNKEDQNTNVRPQDYLFYLQELPSDKERTSLKKYNYHEIKDFPSVSALIKKGKKRIFQFTNRIAQPDNSDLIVVDEDLPVTMTPTSFPSIITLPSNTSHYFIQEP